MKLHELAKILLWVDVRDKDVPKEIENKVISLVPLRHREIGIGLPKLYSLRCFDNTEKKLFQSWEFSDYLEYCDTLAHIFNEYNGERITGCYFKSVAVFSGGFEMVIWEKRYD